MSEVKLYVKGRPNGLFADTTRPATAEEIKEAHPKCGTCLYAELLKHATAPRDYYICGVNDDLAIDLAEDYCRHHTPKEGV